MMIETIFVLASYLVGAIPFGLLIGRLAGTDVRLAGSGNIGATNVGRVLGKRLGVLTLLCDLGKGFLSVWAAMKYLPASAAQREGIIALCGLAAVIGHLFPLYLRFKGGKGVATALGIFLALSPWSALISLFVFLGAVMASGFVSVGSLLASALIPVWLWLLGESPAMVAVSLLTAVLIWFKHGANITRLRRGQEKSWRKSGS